MKPAFTQINRLLANLMISQTEMAAPPLRAVTLADIEVDGGMVGKGREVLETYGCVVLKNVLDPATALDPILAEYDRRLDDVLASMGAPTAGTFAERLAALYNSGTGVHHQAFNISLPAAAGIPASTPVHTGAAIFALLRSPAILDAVEDVLGGEILSNPIQHARLKPPERMVVGGAGQGLVRAIDWHQDAAAMSADADATDFLTVWVPVTDATEAMGCMVVQPGSHRERSQLQRHCPGMRLPGRDAAPSLVVPMERGSILVFHKLLVHKSLPNVSDAARVSLDLRYSVAGQKTGRDVFPEFLARSAADPAAVLDDPAEYARAWWRARDALAATDAKVYLGVRWNEPGVEVAASC